MTYRKDIFDAATMRDAMNIVLSYDPNNPDKFITETNLLVSVILDADIINKDSLLLDFGCGIGRVSRPLIELSGCSVIGLDQSEKMLEYAEQFVNNEKFTPTTSYEIPESIDVVMAILALQHSEFPEVAIQNIVDVLKPGGYFILCNEPFRLIPRDVTDDGWVVWGDDKKDVYALVAEKLKEVARSNKAGGLDVILFVKES